MQIARAKGIKSLDTTSLMHNSLKHTMHKLGIVLTTAVSHLKVSPKLCRDRLSSTSLKYHMTKNNVTFPNKHGTRWKIGTDFSKKGPIIRK